MMEKKSFWEVIARVIVAAITAALTALTTTSCMGQGPLF
ncbi:MAG: smalltalk protein [Prevotella sp.]|nr:smalltalk protein [Prevotella sp.]